MKVLALANWTIMVVALLVTASSTWAGASGDSPCNVEETRVVAFSGAKARDSIRIAVVGSSCLDAVFVVQIKNSDGSPLYGYEAPLSAFYPSGDPIGAQPPEELPKQARRLVTSNLPASPLSTSAELPSYQHGHFELDSMFDGKALVDEARYARLRSAGLPVFDHSTAHEAGRYVVYDPETNAAVSILQWWL